MKSSTAIFALSLGACTVYQLDCLAQDLETKVKTFQNDARDIYRLDEDSRQAIWEAYCGKLDPEEEDNVRLAKEIGYSYQQKENDKVHRLLGTGNELIEQADKMRSNSDTKDKGNALMETLQKEVENLEKLDDGVVLKGSNHAFVQYAIEYGKRMHEDMCGRYGNDTRICDKNFPGLNGRPDLVFIDGDGIWIYEFKPDNSEAKSKGDNQVKGYREGVQSYFQRFFPNGRKGAISSGDGDHGGETFLQKIQKNDRCWNSDGSRIEISSDHCKVVTYNPCEKRF